VIHWLIVAALLGYLWMLVKIAKPKPTTQPIKTSKTWLIAQTAIAWTCAVLFGFLTLVMMANANRPRPQNPYPREQATSVGYFVGLLIADLGVPLLFALSVRWTRTVISKWKALRLPPAAEPTP
jgi:hypothetical protein